MIKSPDVDFIQTAMAYILMVFMKMPLIITRIVEAKKALHLLMARLH
jgi:hypothetical protein